MGDKAKHDQEPREAAQDKTVVDFKAREALEKARMESNKSAEKRSK